jgi:exonuclease III
MNLDLSFSAINCNSLNLSTSGTFHQKLKVYGIVKLKSDLIFLSDVHLSSRYGVRDLKNLEDIFRTNPYCSYRCIFNSTRNKRGVGILIKNTVLVSEVKEVRDPAENFLLISALYNGNRLTLGAVYGPNGNNPEFFRQLSSVITEIGNDKIILGGDWNCLWSRAAASRNIDIRNMVSVPNSGNSAEMRSQFEMLNMSDPYRVLYPGRLDFTYSPRDRIRTNRSRLDYFVISDNLVPSVTSCEISRHLQNKLFDHRAISLNFNKKHTGISRPTINNAILKDPDIEIIVSLAVAETYIRHTLLPGIDKQLLMRQVGTARSGLRSAGPDPIYRDCDALTEDDILQRSGIIAGIKASIEDINLDRFYESVLDIDDGLFLDTLINNTRNEVIGYQNFIRNALKRNELLPEKKLDGLKGDFEANESKILEL